MRRRHGLAVLAEYLTGGLDPRRLRVLAARVVAIGKMLDGAGFLDIFESLRQDHRIPARTAWNIAIRDVLFVGKLSVDRIPLIQELLERKVLQPPWVRPRWLDVPGARERLEKLRGGASITDLYEREVS
jgi:hypothetical protein